MKREKRGFNLIGAIGWLFGLFFALALGGAFYGVMAYQLLGDAAGPAAQVQADGGRALLVLENAQLISEQTMQQVFGGETCTVSERIYRLQDGTQAEAVSASPAAYIERLSQDGWTPQAITGFTLAGLEAVYSRRGEESMLCARRGECIYMLRADADEQTLYALGAGALLQ